ncbi:UDP-N-acetylglucosamine 4,6-dehydratase (inverting) [Desulfurobacterium sp.]|uniref:UDP-N-acetylglucosamine 4,6-dehydratase (inverting) n=1 Tax=Desulfurobacterium sp. TaxID=2004706 RepID=UPI002608CDBC|nr:UDP-N-acetylglucosamine 4,6-dehydratase (inverting) [Desulfurobacterium sp.]
MSSVDGRVILITGGTGSFGKKFAKRILENYNPKKVIIYSRDEYKQYWMQQELKKHIPKLRFFLGDVRDRERLYRAFDGVDIVVHAAALKQVPLLEYNPIEAVKTNIYGAENIINAAIDMGVEKVIALSTDKAVNPVNLYGATKLVADKLFVAANAYAGGKKTRFAVVRYGNVAGSRGSVIPYFLKLVREGKRELPITDFRMTRFWITLDEGIDMVLKAIRDARGGEIFVPKIPSFKVTDLARAICPDCKLVEIGVRPGEKIHEVMITEEDARTTYDYGSYYVIYPVIDWKGEGIVDETGRKVPDGFRYSSDSNSWWLYVGDLRGKLQELGFTL